MEQLHIIKTTEKIDELLIYLQDKDFIAFDTETTGTSKESSIIGFSVCAEIERAYYVILGQWDKEQGKMTWLPGMKESSLAVIKLLVSKNLIMHNAVFDCDMVFNNFGIQLIQSVHTDTMILAHLLDENRHCGLKELGVSIFGEDARQEQIIMKESVTKNGGMLTKDKYELYKADADLIGRYGAKDTVLTLKLFYHMVPQLYEEGLDDFFYKDESMPLLRGPTYQLNTTGLKVDANKLQSLRGTLEVECEEAKAFIHREIQPYIQDKYPGTSKTKTFNIGATKQWAWLLFDKLGCEFNVLTDSGRDLCRAIDFPIPYSPVAKRNFIQRCKELKTAGFTYKPYDKKKKIYLKEKKIADYWHYIKCDSATLQKFSKKFVFVDKLLTYAKNLKLLNTYVVGIQQRLQYGLIRPSFLQHGTTSGRYSSRNPNFQNLPRKEKRVKACVISRPGKVFVGADYSQLEPRVFASFSGDERLLGCFKDADDFYSVIGVEVFDKPGLSLKKEDPNSFAVKYPDLRDKSKVIALSAAYGTTAAKMAPALGKSIPEAQEIIDNYFESFPKVKTFMLNCHKEAQSKGVVKNLFGRPRRMPAAKNIGQLYGKTEHAKLPYEVRNILNLAVNHTIQSTGASIMNKASIAFYESAKIVGIDAKIVMQVHDELIVECDEKDGEMVVIMLKTCMELAVNLPGVDLIAEPKIAYNLADLK